MKDTLTSIIAAIKILRKENQESEALEILEDALKQLCKLYIMDMSAMSSVIGFDQVKEELENGLKLLNIVSQE
ncbi:MAG: hypothetical protein LGR52_06665 [Candidatus Thiosymbion ectosymbiont of Robbea hypermnestra]|nr:hypothetical protein [Candidatus Thiosymbion ectosymbiont of Robbea hypermnestra]